MDLSQEAWKSKFEADENAFLLDVLEKLDQQIENTEIEILKPLDIEEQRTLRSLINKMTLKN